MGDRISIQFKNGKDKSVVLFSHWGGISFLNNAKEYVKELKKWTKKQQDKAGTPLNRLEPQTVMVDFVRHITKSLSKVEGNLYFGFDSNDGDNSNNGHFTLNLLEQE